MRANVSAALYYQASSPALYCCFLKDDVLYVAITPERLLAEPVEDGYVECLAWLGLFSFLPLLLIHTSSSLSIVLA